jgi:ATP phosphoribosyltransferase regulatory subunit
MTSRKHWLLPDGVDELLPERAKALEQLRRRLLDCCDGWGYRYVIPPLVEFTDSLLVGLGADLDLVTCKFADRLSGRTLGVRADMTPQAARIDAHSLGETGVTRLCYAGSTLHSAPETATSGRSPIQLGAEVYGSASSDADLEVIGLMLTLIDRVGLAPHHKPVTLDVGHVGIYDAVMAASSLNAETVNAVFDALQRKSQPDLQHILRDSDDALVARLQGLMDLHGGADTLALARQKLADIPEAIEAIDQIDRVVSYVQAHHPEVSVYIDLTELRGFRYHTGLVFAAYVAGVGNAIAKGGRYDNVGSVFGRERPATGFTCDLKALAEQCATHSNPGGVISAPIVEDAALNDAILALRAQGRIVVNALEGIHDPRCTEQLIKEGDHWVCQPLA